MTLIPVYLIFIPIVASMIIYVVTSKRINYLIYLVQATITILSIIYYRTFLGFDEPHILLLGGWEKAIGVSLRNDALSISFIFLAIFTWWMVIIYCWDRRKEDYKFLFFLLFLEGCFLALLQANDLFTLFVLIEIITITSTILIVYKKDGNSVRAGLYYLIFNSTGMLFYLIGIALMYSVTGSLNMDIARTNILDIVDTNVIKISYTFLIAAIGVKSAFFPVFNWLPKAHGAANAAVSALLSGLLVKSGIYAFIRINEVYNLELFYDFFFYLGFLTAISGIIFASSQKDIKQVLSFSTISQIGVMLMGISSFDGKTYIGGIIHIFNHAMFKCLLFMGAGHIINEYGTKNITKIRGVFRRLPLMSIFMIIGMLSITGAPMFNGFVSKTVIKYGLRGNNIQELMLFIVNLGTCVYFIKMSQVFFGRDGLKGIRKVNEHVSLFVLSMMCIILGNYLIPITRGFFGVDISFIRVISLSNWINYFIILAVAYLIHKIFLERDYNIIKKIRNTNISFETTNFMLIFFIFIMIFWSKIV